ncbi:EscU/YscU/HrcU family type III secretion system export apparatus switch protein [Halovulum sp. GXIMD14793]
MSEENGSAGEKVHDPTPKRLEDARKKGDIAKSAEVTAAAAYTGFLIALLALGGPALQAAGGAMMQFLAQPDRLTGQVLGPGGFEISGSFLARISAALAPFILLPAGAVLAALIAQRAFAPSLSKLAPKLSRISILANAKNKFGPTGLVEFAKSAVKLMAISLVATLLLRSEIETVIGATRAQPGGLSLVLGGLLIRLLIGVTLIATVIAFIDYSWQQFDHKRKLRMSHQDMKDEHKESEGDPHMKSRRRQRAQEIASNRMLSDVPTADVIIVNPTHYAVALSWDRKPGSAPVCIAKGVDEIAMKIRELAAEHAVPLHRDAPTARALHATVEIGHQIPPEHYRAVAAAIRFAESMRAQARSQSWGQA